MIYIFDIDGTICNTPLVDGHSSYNTSEPIKPRINCVNELYLKGHTIIYWTARGASTGLDWSELTSKQLKDWGCLYHELRLGKPNYDIWVDDKAINDLNFFEETKC
jgi:hypothetical protein